MPLSIHPTTKNSARLPRKIAKSGSKVMQVNAVSSHDTLDKYNPERQTGSSDQIRQSDHGSPVRAVVYEHCEAYKC